MEPKLKVCKHVKCVTPIEEQAFAKNKAQPDGLQVYCKACKARMHQEYINKPGVAESRNKKNSEYFKSEAGKATAKRSKDKYRSTEEGKAMDKAYKVAYRKTSKGKAIEAASRAKYNASAHGQEVSKAYWKTEKGREVIRVSNGNRRAMILSTSDGTITYQSLQLLKIEQPNCFYCEKQLDFNAPNGAHLDHYVPLTKSGAHSITNVVWSCPHCNHIKGNKLPEDFIKEINNGRNTNSTDTPEKQQMG